MSESCNGCCGSCGGCAKELCLCPEEIDFLQTLGQIPFLPVARKAQDMAPVYLEDRKYTPEQYSTVLQLLEKKSLIDIDYLKPLGGFDMSAYSAYPVHGTIALTARGQAVLETLDIQGFTTE